MHANELAAHGLAMSLLARCRNGFDNHFEHMNWRKKHNAEIESLPLDLRNAVCLAWDQATAKEFSK